MKSETHRNVAFNLPAALLKDFKVFAAERNQSMTALAAETIRKLMEAPRDRKAAGASLYQCEYSDGPLQRRLPVEPALWQHASKKTFLEEKH